MLPPRVLSWFGDVPMTESDCELVDLAATTPIGHRVVTKTMRTANWRDVLARTGSDRGTRPRINTCSGWVASAAPEFIGEPRLDELAAWYSAAVEPDMKRRNRLRAWEVRSCTP